MELTTERAKQLKIPAGKADHVEWDAKLSGFGVRINAGGKRSWVIQSRLHGQSRRMTIGSVDKMNADKARSAAKILLGKIEQGIDPSAEKAQRVKAAGITFGRQTAAFLDYARERTRPRTMEELTRHLNEHWAPFQSMSLESIHRADVAARLNELKKERGPVAANRSRTTLFSFFGWAMREGLTERNPVIGTNLPAEEQARERVLSADELVAIWNASGESDYGRVVRLLMLTGQRRTEVGGMPWAELDLSKRMWSMPPERTKNWRPHDVPLSDECMAILEGVDRTDGRVFVFGRLDTGFTGWGKSKAKLDQRISAQRPAKERSKAAPWRLHDLRRTVATGMAEIGVLPHIIESVLNHVSGHKGGIAGIYNLAEYAVEKRQALDRWAAHVTALVAGKGHGKVVTLRTA